MRFKVALRYWLRRALHVDEPHERFSVGKELLGSGLVSEQRELGLIPCIEPGEGSLHTHVVKDTLRMPPGQIIADEGTPSHASPGAAG